MNDFGKLEKHGFMFNYVNTKFEHDMLNSVQSNYDKNKMNG